MWNFTKINDSRMEFIENDLRIGQKIDLRFYKGFAYLNLQEVRMFHKYFITFVNRCICMLIKEAGPTIVGK